MATNQWPWLNGRNGHSRGDGTVTDRERLAVLNDGISSLAYARQAFLDQLADPRRDLDAECGWPAGDTEVSTQLYRQLYDRFDVATRVVQVYPKECWQMSPLVYDDEDPDKTTDFEEAWDALGKTLTSGSTGGQSWHGEEQGSSVWEYLRRADELSGIGHFGVILLGIDDGKNLQDPVDGVMVANTSKADEAKLHRLGKTLANHSDPAPMPGYGQIFVKGSKVWYVGGDGDDKGFDRLVQQTLGAVKGVSEVTYEAEAFPPRDDKDWRQVYPEWQKPALNLRDVVQQATGGCGDSPMTEAEEAALREPKSRPVWNGKYERVAQDGNPANKRLEPVLEDYTPPKLTPAEERVVANWAQGRERVKEAQQLAAQLERQALNQKRGVEDSPVDPPMLLTANECKQIDDFVKAKLSGRIVLNNSHWVNNARRIDFRKMPESRRPVKPSSVKAISKGTPTTVPFSSGENVGGQSESQQARSPADVLGYSQAFGLGMGNSPTASNPGNTYPPTGVQAAAAGGYGQTAPKGGPKLGKGSSAQMPDSTRGKATAGFADGGPPNGQGYGGSIGYPPSGSDGTPQSSDYSYGGSGQGATAPGSSLAGTDQQYFGVQYGPSEFFGEQPTKQHKLLFLRCFDESLVQIVRYEWNVRNPRFGLPVMYRITLNDPREQNSGIGLPLATVFVHWSRVIHVADNLSSSEIFGVPRLRPVLNSVLDDRKISGSSAEGYFRAGCSPVYSMETHPQLGGDVEVDKGGLQDMVEQVTNGLQRWMLTSGIAVKTLPPAVIDPKSYHDIQIEKICIQLAMPVRVFKGSERGELASSQDDETWNERVIARRNFYLTPRVIVPFVDRLIQLGILPEPESDDGYKVHWPDPEALSDKDKAGIGFQNTQALSAYIAGNCESVVAPHDFLTSEKFLGMDDEEAEAIIDATQKAHENEDTMTNPPMISGQPAEAAEGTQQAADQDAKAEQAKQASQDKIAQLKLMGQQKQAQSNPQGEEGVEAADDAKADEPPTENVLGRLPTHKVIVRKKSDPILSETGGIQGFQSRGRDQEHLIYTGLADAQQAADMEAAHPDTDRVEVHAAKTRNAKEGGRELTGWRQLKRGPDGKFVANVENGAFVINGRLFIPGRDYTVNEDSDIGHWVTLKGGMHILVGKGQDIKAAIKQHFASREAERRAKEPGKAGRLARKELRKAHQHGQGSGHELHAEEEHVEDVAHVHGHGHALEHAAHEVHTAHEAHEVAEVAVGGHEAHEAAEMAHGAGESGGLAHDTHQGHEAAHHVAEAFGGSHEAHEATQAAHEASHEVLSHGDAEHLEHPSELDAAAIIARHAYNPALKAATHLVGKIPGGKRTAELVSDVHDGVTKIADAAVKALVGRYGHVTAAAILGAGSLASKNTMRAVGIPGHIASAVPGHQFIDAIPLLAVAETGKRLGLVGPDSKLEKGLAHVGTWVHAIRSAVGHPIGAALKGAEGLYHRGMRAAGKLVRKLTGNVGPIPIDPLDPNVDVEKAAEEFWQEYAAECSKMMQEKLEKHKQDRPTRNLLAEEQDSNTLYNDLRQYMRARRWQ